MVRTALCLMLFLHGFALAQDSPPSCKPVKHYNVNGCELLPDQTCPAGYHKQAVDPPNPMMAAPTFLMCAPDKAPSRPKPKERSPKKN